MQYDVIRRQKDRAAQILQKGRVAAALEEYQRILKAVPGDVTVRQKVAELLAREGRKPEAVREYSETVRRYAEGGHFFKATALCRVILTLDPSHQATQQTLAELYAARGKSSSLPQSQPAPAPKLDVTAVAPAVTPVKADDEPEVEIEVEELAFEAEAPPPPRGELPSIPLFSSLSADAFMALLRDAMEARVFRAGETVLNEGDEGEAMFALAEGHVDVQRHGRTVATMHEGDFFGEMALLSGARRLATVVAGTDVVLLAFPRAAMEALIAKHPAVREGLDAFFRERLLANVLRANELFASLAESQRAALAQAFTPAPVHEGSVLIQQGQPGAAVYVLLRGSCRVYVNDGGAFPELREGDVFGEISVVSRMPATASVAAKENGVVLKVEADAFRRILSSHEEVKVRVLRLASERMSRRPEPAPDDWRV